MPYLELITDAFHLVRRNRYLWFYGLFAGGASFNFQVAFPIDPDGSSSGGGPSVDTEVLIAIAVGIFALLLVFMMLNTISQGALADSVAATKRGELQGFATAWRAGLKSFWRVLGLGLLAGIAALALVLAVLSAVALFVVVVGMATQGTLPVVIAAMAAGVPAIVVLFGLFGVLGVTVQVAIRHLVLARARVVESVGAGWRLVRENLVPSGAILLIQQAATFAGSIVVTLAVVLLCAPAVVLLIAGATAVGIAVAILTALIVIPLGLTAYGALGAFNHSLWTLAYLQLTGGAAGREALRA